MTRAVWIALAFGLAACGGGGGGDGGPPASGGGGISAPTISGPSAVNFLENGTGVAATVVAGGGNLTLGLSGPDARRFAISQAGAITFLQPPDFELANDLNFDNVYEVTASAGNAIGEARLPIRITVTNVSGRLSTRRVGQGFASPLFVAGTADGTGRVFVVERAGRIRILEPRNGQIAAAPFLDIVGQTTTDGERGLLGFTVAPDYASTGIFYIGLTNLQGDTEIRRYRRSAQNADLADPQTADVIFFEAQPASNHNGGWIGFGADGLLYVPLGDGGGAGDPPGRAQNRQTVLGKVLRIDPRTDAFPADQRQDYAIPPSNPFVNVSGTRPEIWAIGVRNPYRNSFDRQTGDLYLGDVGQGAIEEVSRARAGEGGLNFGWNILEGTQPFAQGSTVGLTPPVAQYSHGTGPLNGRSITGGYVYRGPIAALRGEYVFGDFVNRRVWSFPVSAIAPGQTLGSTQFTDRTAAFAPDVGSIGNISSFGEDDQGNLYIVDFDGEIFHVTEIE
jgi:glucose/arabinose dehydrogenase